MRYAALILVACSSDAQPVRPDAAPYVPDASPYVACVGWEQWYGDVALCDPECANKNAIGQWDYNTCFYTETDGDTRPCNYNYMTENYAQYPSRAGCCVLDPSPFRRVEFMRCNQP
jgi:hypothetical protein